MSLKHPSQETIEILFLEAVSIDKSGQHEQASALYTKILKQNPRHAYALYLLGAHALRNNNNTEAIRLINSAIAENNNEPTFYLYLGQALYNDMQYEGALKAYKNVLHIQPNYEGAQLQYANCLQKLDRIDECISIYQSSIETIPKRSANYFQLANLYKDQGEPHLACSVLEQLLNVHPQLHDAYIELGSLLLVQDHFSKAFDLYLKLFNFERGEPAGQSIFKETKDCNNDTDAEQIVASRFFFENFLGHINYLLARNKIHPSYQKLADICQKIINSIQFDEADSEFITLSLADSQSIGHYLLGRLYYSDTAQPLGPALNCCLDTHTIENKYLDGSPSMVYFDDFLSSEALDSLRTFCLESTIFYRQSHNTYIASYISEGFNCSLLYQIVRELRKAFPRILGNLELQNIWGYRQAPEGDGVRPHSDMAAVTINFWLTPNSANLDPDRGGLILYDKEQPLDWDWMAINRDKDKPEILAKIRDYLADATTITIPYRENRAVIFHSNTFHQSDAFRFKSGYENSRMNITMIFGERHIQSQRKSKIMG